MKSKKSILSTATLAAAAITAAVVSGKYPLARFLYLYVNRAPNKPLDPVVREFLKLVFSREGQEVVLKDGYLPLTAQIASEERARVQ